MVGIPIPQAELPVKMELEGITAHRERFGDLLDSGMWTDVTFELGKTRAQVKAHRLVLKTISPVFAKLLTHPYTGPIPLPKFERSNFQLMLKYIYTGRAYVTAEEALPLLKIGHYFEIWDLVKSCNQLLECGLIQHTALTIFQQARQCGDHKWAEAALNIICRKFLDLAAVDLAVILQQDGLQVANELQLFEAVVSWGRAECHRLQLAESVQYMRSVLENLIPLIRFPLMTSIQFTRNVVSTQLLTNDELLSILMYINANPDSRSGISAGGFSSKPRIYTNHFLA